MSPAYERKKAIDTFLASWLRERSEVRLGEATRAVDNAGVAGAGVNTRIVADRLRLAYGFKRVGWAGSGYDREPVYRRELSA